MWCDEPQGDAWAGVALAASTCWLALGGAAARSDGKRRAGRGASRCRACGGREGDGARRGARPEAPRSAWRCVSERSGGMARQRRDATHGDAARDAATRGQRGEASEGNGPGRNAMRRAAAGRTGWSGSDGRDAVERGAVSSAVRWRGAKRWIGWSEERGAGSRWTAERSGAVGCQRREGLRRPARVGDGRGGGGRRGERWRGVRKRTGSRWRRDPATEFQA